MPILSFARAETETLFQAGKSKRLGNIAAVAPRKLDFVAAAAELIDLRSPPATG